MKKTIKSIIAFLLIATTLLGMSISVFAAKAEEYVCELRLIYAEDYNEAKAILADSEFTDYKIYKENLNKNSGKIGVWLAYKTTTDIDDAITDIAIMQMDGGYREGNYQVMIKESYAEYLAMGDTYLEAIQYFANAYGKNDTLAKLAYRQLNFYSGLDDREGEDLGEIFVNGIEVEEVATMFFEGNSYVLQNIRALLAMGVAYNADGKTYFQKVADAAAQMNADGNAFNNSYYEELAEKIAPTVKVFQKMFKELSAYEDELDYTDEELTDLEIKYAEYKAIADKMRKVDYLDGKTLYDLCIGYKDSDGVTPLLPLVAAMNAGQKAMAKVAHYYDVVRYGMTVYSEEIMDEKIIELEATYADDPFDIYTGVDRSIYDGTFALTTDAYRADAYTASGLSAAFGTDDRAVASTLSIVGSACSIGMFVTAIIEDYGDYLDRAEAMGKLAERLANQKSVTDIIAAGTDSSNTFVYTMSEGAYMDSYTMDTIISHFITQNAPDSAAQLAGMNFYDKFMLYKQLKASGALPELSENASTFANIEREINNITQSNLAQSQADHAANFSFGTSAFSTVMYIAGGLMMLYSAYNIISTIVNYYNPDYADVPLSMVELIETVDGDRYIKYDVVFEAEAKGDKGYAAGDLNAYEGARWNAVYYTKSYEAGMPLLANAFTVSNTSNKAKSGYTPVHRFGEEICYDLNKYNFEGNTSIYLSVKQSKNQKSAVADVPQVVGSVFGTGFIVLAGSIGTVAGIGGTIATYGIVKKKKKTKYGE